MDGVLVRRELLSYPLSASYSSLVKLLVMNMGGKGGAVFFWLQYFVLQGGMRLSQVLENWVLALWSGQYESDDDANVPVVL